MAKFIEIHINGVPILANLDYISIVGANGIVDKDSDIFRPDEDYQQLRTIIAAAQGGIPMDRSGMY